MSKVSGSPMHVSQMKTNRHGELLLIVSDSWTNRYFELDHFSESLELYYKTCLNDSVEWISRIEVLHKTQICKKNICMNFITLTTYIYLNSIRFKTCSNTFSQYFDNVFTIDSRKCKLYLGSKLLFISWIIATSNVNLGSWNALKI